MELYDELLTHNRDSAKLWNERGVALEPARVVAVGAVLAAAIIVAVTLLGGGSGYRVHARFVNASQLVKGNLVQVAGRAVGAVERIELTKNGRATLYLRQPSKRPIAGVLPLSRRFSPS